jgi:AcrR family transcriptional regulator
MMYSEMSTKVGKRKYVLKKRASRQADTRRRIVESTIALHKEVGPGATQVSEIARRAGVQRVTVYNHFADEGSLFAACSAHWRALHPGPDPQRWLTSSDPAVRLRVGLRELYAWYRQTAPMIANVLRDAEVLPALRRVIETGLLRYLDLVPAVLTEPFKARGKRRDRIQLAARAAVDFHFWRALEPLGDEQAAELGAGLVEIAAG